MLSPSYGFLNLEKPIHYRMIPEYWRETQKILFFGGGGGWGMWMMNITSAIP